MKKIIILIGNYGSGKTEIALNMAVRAAAEGKRTQVIDLDKINDYFRMSDRPTTSSCWTRKRSTSSPPPSPARA